MKQKPIIKKLTSSRCLCRGCNEYFNSVYAFDKHRVGVGGERRCMTQGDMNLKGFEKNQAGFWTTGLKKGGKG